MTTNHRMEGLSRAYLQAVAAQAGVNLQYQFHDYGVDFSLREVTRIGREYVDTATVIDVQLRSTTRAAIRDDVVAFDLDVETYNFLRQRRANVPCLLMVLILPGAEAEWLGQSEDGLTLRRCMYWHSLSGLPATRARSSVRVLIPRANRFDVLSLRALMGRARRGEL